MTDKSDLIDRFLAAVLMAGGLLGAVIFLYVLGNVIVHLDLHTHPLEWISLTIVAFLFALFVWSAIVGVRLWRRESRGWKWATILFAMQIPVLTVSGLHYEYHTGIALDVIGGHVADRFAAQFGSQGSILLTPGSTDLIYGVNLFAVAAVVYLLMRRNEVRNPKARDAG